MLLKILLSSMFILSLISCGSEQNSSNKVNSEIKILPSESKRTQFKQRTIQKNKNNPTGEIEIEVSSLEVLNASKIPPFTIEDETDGGDDLRMQYRYLDLRRKPVQANIMLRHRVGMETRSIWIL
mgnify:CR=1 FL=1